MKYMGLNEIREKYLSFFESKGHLRLPSFPLVPINDKSILLINAGMTPLKPYFTGQEIPPQNRVTTCQKCIRTPDIESVGKTARHGTFFEMLGNFSFGDYFKHEATAWAWEFLTSVMGIPADKLWITVYEEDDEAVDIWTKEVGVNAERIHRLSKEENFWEHGMGPCGPCSEIHYDRGEKHGCGKPGCAVGCDCDRYMEVWNLVFTQFDKDSDGNYNRLPKPNIDTGMGLERLACVMQDVQNLFEVDTIRNTMKHIIEIAKVAYGKDENIDVSLRIITDHIRGTSFMICDGILPSNEGRGYVLRRLLRRAARHGKLLGIDEAFLYKVADTVVGESKGAYPELNEKKDYITKVIRAEEEKFEETIDQGLSVLGTYIEEITALGIKILDGERAFKLYDTYGFPIDLTREILEEKKIGLDEDGFKEQVQSQKQVAKAAHNKDDSAAWGDDVYSKLSKELVTEFIGYDADKCTSKICGLIVSGEIADSAIAGDDIVIVTDRTVFYAEMGGQVGDIGTISTKNCVIEIADCKKKGDKFLHIGKVISGSTKLNETVEFAIDIDYRSDIERGHSATHIIQKALRNIIGDHVYQAGSAVSADRLRFDFTHFEGITKEELLAVEKEANRIVLSALPVKIESMSMDDAKKAGAMALFGEKYSQVVRTVKMGDYSFELCGGCHVINTSQIGLIKILSENGIASGVRRIEAVTGNGVMEYVYKNQDIMEKTAIALKSNVHEIDQKSNSIVADLKNAYKQIEALSSKLASGSVGDMMKNAKEIGGISAIIEKVENVDIDGLRALGDELKNKLPCSVIVLAGIDGEKLTFIAMATKPAMDKGAHAGNIVKEIAQIAGGGGGGRPNSAQAGGKDLSKISDALARAEEILRNL